MQLHHFFVLTQPGAPEAQRLCELGLIEGPRNDHPGQGTANRRFFFANTTLELLYVRSAAEAEGGPGRGLQLAKRAEDRAASPFGLIMRAPPGQVEQPFEGWRYCPDYFPPHMCFLVGENSDCLAEPLCICMPPDVPESAVAPQSVNPALHLTGLLVRVPVSCASATLARVAATAPITLELDQPHGLELIFNEGRGGFCSDLGPELPLVLRW